MVRVEMLGTLQAKTEEATITRFRTRRVGLLLAYLAYYRDRHHSREELADMLWPDLEPDHARRNLRQALSSLRHHLEPPSVPAGAVLLTKQGSVSLSVGSVTTDVDDFQLRVRTAAHTSDNLDKINELKAAIEIFRGDLMPGYYEEWVQRERLLLEDLLVSTLQNLVEACEGAGLLEEAIRYVRLAIAKDHLKEDLHTTLIRLYLASERPASARRHFQDWQSLLSTELGAEPSEELNVLMKSPPPERRRPSSERIDDQADRSEEEPKGVANLPVQLTRFFGREADRDRATSEFTAQESRLVTLTGPAGMGKTRLAIETGRTLAEEHGWNVWFVPLADLNDGSNLLNTVVESLKLRFEAGANATELINAQLSGTKNLLILDNLEHILEETIPGIVALLSEVPAVSLLLTSRQSLKLGGEREFVLDSLPVPEEDPLAQGALVRLAATPCVRLFVDRAQGVLPDFQVTHNNAQAVGEICRRLDGLPLAIEIAAGLSGAFTPSQMLKNLENRLEILRSRRRDLSPRHRSLRAAIDYSFDILSPELQRLFVELSVFRGGFTVEAVSEICTREGQAKHGDWLRMILDLQERSLIRSEESGEGCAPRYRMLESFREYGAERLDEADQRALGQRHADHFLRLDREKAMGERENRLAALQFFFSTGQVHECVVLLQALYSFALVGQETILALTDSANFDQYDPLDQIVLLRLLANAHLYPSQFEESYRVSQRALEIAVTLGLEDQIAICRRGVSIAAGYLGRRDEAIALDREFVAYAEKAGDLRMMENAYNGLGTDHWMNGDLEEAFRNFQEALRISIKLNQGDPVWLVLYNLARVSLDAGRLDDGFEFANEGLRLAQRSGDDFGISMNLALVGRYHRMNGNLAAALATSREALIKRRKAGFLYWTLLAIQDHAAALTELAHPREAATLLASVRAIGKAKREPDVREFVQHVARVKAELADNVFEQAWAEGLALGVEQAFQLAVRQSQTSYTFC